MSDRPTTEPRTDLVQRAPDWMRPFMEPDGNGLHADDAEDVALFLDRWTEAAQGAAPRAEGLREALDMVPVRWLRAEGHMTVRDCARELSSILADTPSAPAATAERERAERLDPEDVRAVLNQHESECSYYDGGDFVCSCGYDAAAERVSEWLDAHDDALDRKRDPAQLDEDGRLGVYP